MLFCNSASSIYPALAPGSELEALSKLSNLVYDTKQAVNEFGQVLSQLFHFSLHAWGLDHLQLIDHSYDQLHHFTLVSLQLSVSLTLPETTQVITFWYFQQDALQS
jgi:hypothetical protein